LSGRKQLWSEVDHSPPSSTKGKNNQSNNPIAPHLHGMHRETQQKDEKTLPMDDKYFYSLGKQGEIV
jgi:hypothetical protein